jgi:hypothetical protein
MPLDFGAMGSADRLCDVRQEGGKMERSKRLRVAHRFCMLAALSAGLLLACFAVSGVALAGGGNSANAKKCQKGGWQTLQTSTGGTFASQDECVSYAAQGGELFKPSLVAVPTEVVENQGIDLTASGFHPSTSATVDIVLFGGGSITLGAVTDATGGRSFSSVFTSGACAEGITGAEFTFTDSFGLHASVTVTLDCP